MKLNTYLPIIVLVAVVILHFLANSIGVYDAQIQSGFVWIDNVLHALVGSAFALVWLLIAQKRNLEGKALFISTISFVANMALAWELLEWLIFMLYPTFALELKIYSPTILEAATDIGSNIVGGLIPAMFARYLND